MSRVLKNGEVIWVSYYNRSGSVIAIMASKPTRDFYFLYEVSPDGALKKLGRAKTPTELEKKYAIYERMKEK